MIPKFEQLGLGLILAPIAPLVGFLSLWWGTYYVSLPERWVVVSVLIGLLLGLVVDFLYLPRWISQFRQFSFPLWIAIHLFYSMGIFGMFMGVPVFNVLLAIPAGFVVAVKLNSVPGDRQQVQRQARFTARFTTGILVLICFAAALIALTDPYTSANLEGMLGLDFEITRGMLLSLIVVGGAILLALNWWLTLASIQVSSWFLRGKVA